MKTASHTTVADANGGHYVLGYPIGTGAQGTVYLCESNPRVAIKIIHHATQQQKEVLRQQLAAVKRMDLGRLPIARPVAMLAPPQIGYVMELVSGMRAISSLFLPSRGTESIRDWYVATGGMRRRLQILTRLARTLSKIHGKGLVYGDPSPGNILVSAAADRDEVFLIDSDNLRTSSNPNKTFLFTPGYGAPELLDMRSGINSLTDAHAFTVIAFQILSLCHPLIGDAVADGEPMLEEAALRGQLPWIEHPSDTSNRCSRGIPRNLVLSEKLRALFEAAFQDGLQDPLKRPGIAEWADALVTASAVTIVCPACGWSYYYSSVTCPICSEQRPDCILARIVVWSPSKDNGGGLCVGPNKEPLIVGGSVGTGVHPLTIDSKQLGYTEPEDAICFRASLKGDRIELSSVLEDKSLHVANQPGDIIRPLSTKTQSFRLARPTPSLYVHCGDLETVHRVIQIFFLPGGVR